MTFTNAQKYLSSLSETDGFAPDLFLRLLELLDHPERAVRTVQAHGNAGKSSCLLFLNAILCEAGHEVGCYLPENRVCERDWIFIGSNAVSHSDFCDAISTVRSAADLLSKESGRGLFFRPAIHLAAVLLLFARSGRSLALLEVHADTQNLFQLLPPPLAILLTGESHADNTGWLPFLQTVPGVRPGTGEVISCPLGIETFRIISDVCSGSNCRLTVPAKASLQILNRSVQGCTFRYRNATYQIRPPMDCQILNAVVALEAAQALHRNGYSVRDGHAVQGLARVSLPGRLEIRSVAPFVLLNRTQCEGDAHQLLESLKAFQFDFGHRVRLCCRAHSFYEPLRALLENADYTVVGAYLWTPGMAEEGYYERLPKMLAAAFAELAEDELMLLCGDDAFLNDCRKALIGLRR